MILCVAVAACKIRKGVIPPTTLRMMTMTMMKITVSNSRLRLKMTTKMKYQSPTCQDVFATMKMLFADWHLWPFDEIWWVLAAAVGPSYYDDDQECDSLDVQAQLAVIGADQGHDVSLQLHCVPIKVSNCQLDLMDQPCWDHPRPQDRKSQTSLGHKKYVRGNSIDNAVVATIVTRFNIARQNTVFFYRRYDK